MIIVPRISEHEDFHLPEILLEKTREVDNETRISKKAEMKRNSIGIRSVSGLKEFKI